MHMAFSRGTNINQNEFRWNAQANITLQDFGGAPTNPFDEQGQFCDKGFSYRSVAFYQNEDQKKIIENSKSESIVIRTSWLYSKYGNNFVNTIINKSKIKENLKVTSDQFGCPTYAKDLAEAVMQIIDCKDRIDKEAKVFNYSNEGSTNWFNFAKKILLLYGSKSKIEPVNSKFFKDEVKRPKFSITSKQKIIDTFNLEIDNWDSSLTNYIINDLK